MVPNQSFMKNSCILLLINSVSKYLLNTYYMQRVLLYHVDDMKKYVYLYRHTLEIQVGSVPDH